MCSSNEIPRTLLGAFSIEKFFADHFKKKPLFLKKALPDFISPITPEELAGLACEEGVESRLIENTLRSGESGAHPWTLRHGPFHELDFSELAEESWTLLVQDVDKHVPSVGELLSLVQFLPTWSVDDIMISFASPGGNVGPHTDQYDVFLVQALGTRRWELSESRQGGQLRSDTELKVLKNFSADRRHIATPGDVLYLPPGVAHYGVAEEDALTFSFGFRAPTTSDLVEAFTREVLVEAPMDLLTERRDTSPGCAGELSAALKAEAVRKVAAMVASFDLNGPWLGRFLSERKPQLPSPVSSPMLSAAQFAEMLERNHLSRNSSSRFLFESNDSRTVLYVDGVDHDLSQLPEAHSFTKLLTEQFSFTHRQLHSHLLHFHPLLRELVSAGHLEFHSKHHGESDQ